MLEFEMPPLDWRVYSIPKPNKPGEFRKITEPNDALKKVHEQVLNYLYAYKDLRPTCFAHGFVPGKSTLTAVGKHSCTADVILCMDIEKFFDNFPIDKIREQMVKANMPDYDIDKIMRVCVYKGTVPQGGACSPWLTNIGMIEVDKQISAFVKKHGFIYTRYADDITVSLDAAKEGVRLRRGYKFIFKGIDLILRRELGLHLKSSKNHAIRRKSRAKKQVLGIVIRGDGQGYNAPRGMRRMVRAMVHNLHAKLTGSRLRPAPADYAKWSEILGYIRYMDNIRAHSVSEEASTADPMVNGTEFQELEAKFEKCKKGGQNGRVDHRQQ